MAALGFKHELSIEDAGTGPTNHINSTGPEWWGVFFKPDKVDIADDISTEFLADDRTDHENYERMPHSFAFRTPSDRLDFVLILVHLKPTRVVRARRVAKKNYPPLQIGSMATTTNRKISSSWVI